MKQSSSLIKSSLIVSAMTFLSRILGLVRDIVIANVMGAQAATDVFLVAQKIPNFLRRLFAEGAFSQAFVPVLTEYQQHQSPEIVKALVSKVAGTLGLILFLITLIGVLGSSGIAALFSPGFLLNSPDKFELVSHLIKITFPYIFFISLTALAGAILNTKNRFAVPAFAPVLLNVCLIGAAIWISPLLEEPVEALAWAIFAAGILQLLLHLPFLWREGYLVKPSWGWRDSGVRKILKLMTPAMFGVSVSQVNLLLDTIIASFLVTGSITWLYLSDRLLEFPLGIFGIAIATVILPNLSRDFAKGGQKMSHLLNWGIYIVILIGLPAALGLFVLAEPIMLSVFQHGEYTLEDAFKSALSLQAYALALLSFMLIKVLAPGYFSQQDTKTPVKIGIAAMAVNMVFNLILFKPFGHVGLAIATAISAFVNMFFLWRGLIAKGTLSMEASWYLKLLKIVVATVLMFILIKLISPDIQVWREAGFIERAQYLALILISAIATYLIALFVQGFRLSEIRNP